MTPPTRHETLLDRLQLLAEGRAGWEAPQPGEGPAARAVRSLRALCETNQRCLDLVRSQLEKAQQRIDDLVADHNETHQAAARERFRREAELTHIRLVVEGGPAWDEPMPDEGPTVVAVRELQQKHLRELEHVRTVAYGWAGWATPLAGEPEAVRATRELRRRLERATTANAGLVRDLDLVKSIAHGDLSWADALPDDSGSVRAVRCLRGELGLVQSGIERRLDYIRTIAMGLTGWAKPQPDEGTTEVAVRRTREQLELFMMGETPDTSSDTPADTAEPRDRNESWQHAACLSIAEGAPGWDGPSSRDSAAMIAVRDLRRQLLMLLGKPSTPDPADTSCNVAGCTDAGCGHPQLTMIERARIVRTALEVTDRLGRDRRSGASLFEEPRPASWRDEPRGPAGARAAGPSEPRADRIPTRAAPDTDGAVGLAREVVRITDQAAATAKQMDTAIRVATGRPLVTAAIELLERIGSESHRISDLTVDAIEAIRKS